MIVAARFAFLRQAVRGWGLALLVSLLASSAIAQTAAPPPPPAPPKDVGGPEISMLIRTTMIALHQANVTGNYTVLRDLGASILQSANTAADLSVLFADFRKNRISLAPTVLFDAILDQKPALTTNGVLKLVGHFPTKPQEVVFDLTFAYELGAWRIALLNVGTRMAGDTSAPGPAATDKPAPKPGDKPKPAAAAKPKPKPDPNAAMELIPPTPRVRP